MTEEDNPDLGDDELREELEAEQSESAVDTKKTDKEETAETDTTDDQGDDGEETGDEEDGKGKSFKDTDSPDIPTRNASSIIARQKKTIEKLRSRSEIEEEQSSDDEEAGDEGADVDTDVSREVARQLDPIKQTLAEKEDEAELQRLFTNDPEAKGYERAIRATMKRDAFRQVPAAMIYAYLSREHVLAQGAKRKTVADTEAAHSRGAGSSRRSAKKKKSGNFPSADEIDAMTDDEIEALAQKVETGQSL